MDIATIKMLYDYNYHAHQQVWGCVLKLSDEQYMRPLTYSIGSVHAQLVHTMSAEEVWFTRLRGESPSGMLNPTDYPTRDALRAKWDEIEQFVREYIDELDDAKLASSLAYRRTSGEVKSTPIIGILMHLINHGTDHRAQTLAMIDRVGGETVAQDLIFYLRNQQV